MAATTWPALGFPLRGRSMTSGVCASNGSSDGDCGAVCRAERVAGTPAAKAAWRKVRRFMRVILTVVVIEDVAPPPGSIVTKLSLSPSSDLPVHFGHQTLVACAWTSDSFSSVHSAVTFAPQTPLGILLAATCDSSACDRIDPDPRPSPSHCPSERVPPARDLNGGVLRRIQHPIAF